MDGGSVRIPDRDHVVELDEALAAVLEEETGAQVVEIVGDVPSLSHRSRTAFMRSS
jgi:hypothetical protein